MIAARFYGVGEPLRVEDAPLPECATHEVLVQVGATGLCGSDIHIAGEGITPTPYQPIVLGHEVAGTVAHVGAAVSGWESGDRVAVCAILTDGTCQNCLGGHSEVCVNRKLIGIHTEGGLAEYVKVPARNLCRLPDNVSFPIGAVITDAVATPLHALADVARVTAGESLLVMGAGGLGLHAVQIGRLLGASPVIAVDVRQVQCKRAELHGADIVIDASTGSPVEAVLAATGGAGVDVAAEFVGQPDTISQAVQSLRVGGRAVIVGLGAEPITVLPPTLFVRKQLQLLGSYGFTPNTVRRVLDLLATGRLDLNDSITHTFPLQEANDALRTLRDKIGDPQRIVVLPPSR